MATTNTTSKSKYSYRPVRFGAISFRNASKAARYMYTKTKKTKSEIAQYLGVTPACVTIATRGM